jgi:GntR family transcriptional regulator / MocR family aminotransferase
MTRSLQCAADEKAAVKSAAGVLFQAFEVEAQTQTHVPQGQRLYQALLEAIQSGRLAAGARLPSARQLAAELKVSRGAIDDAFARLQDEGLLLRRVGDGTYVSSPLPRRTTIVPGTAAQREPTPAARQVLRHFAPFMQQTRRFELPRQLFHPPVLHPRAWPVDEFPLARWRKAMTAALGDELRDHLGYGPTAGLPALREAIAHQLALTRGVRCHADQVIIISGPMQGLETAVRVLLSPGDRVWVEDPGHPSLPLLLEMLHLQAVGVPLDAQGLDVARGRALAPDAGLVYLHPLAQYPLGVRTTTLRGAELLHWADDSGAWVIEGCFNDELVHLNVVPPALQSRDQHERVILMGTFEGVMFPSLRVAYLVVPERLRDVFEAARGLLGDHNNVATQIALANFMTEGHFARHVRHLRGVCGERRQALIDAVARHLPETVRLGPLDAGLHACLHLPSDRWLDRELLPLLHRRGIGCEALSARCWQATALNGLIVSYGASPPPAIDRAVRTLAEVLRAVPAPAPGQVGRSPGS